MSVWQTALERSFFQAVAILVVILVAAFITDDDSVRLPWPTALTIVVALTFGNFIYAGIRA